MLEPLSDGPIIVFAVLDVTNTGLVDRVSTRCIANVVPSKRLSAVGCLSYSSTFRKYTNDFPFMIKLHRKNIFNIKLIIRHAHRKLSLNYI